ncbi:MAG: transporter ATP-binding protein [Verrucomicrobiales bacterium]|nr:transporter ATP-binding protein [Verrucomicrobiales bacterium]
MKENTAVIEVQNLVRTFGRADAVRGLNLTVQSGRCYGFFGRNGAGKTTTIKCLLNLLRPTSGSVRLFGTEVRKNEVAIKGRLSYVPDVVAFSSVDDSTEHAGLSRLVSGKMEQGN